VKALPSFEDPEDRDGPITWSGPILVGDRLVLASTTGQVVALSPYDGDVLGQVALPEGARVAPIVANGTVYVLTEDADIVALR
jgi:outer membrane protein assembly factor BamB